MSQKCICALSLCLLAATRLPGDEGMWLVNQFPKQAIEKKYGFQVSDDLLKHIQLSSVRFNNGGSGSFVSPNGLLFTNHHVGRDCIQKVSSAQNDYIANGFYASSLAEEKKCPDLEINVLLRIEEVTDQVNSKIAGKMEASEANRARKAAMTAIEKECVGKTGNRCDVVSLYSGGRYDLYQYRKFTDVRLVFAPEETIAAFGGDPDNFTYPRYCLDFSLFRAYENGKPVQPEHYFKWSRAGVEDGELTFVPGNPGTTGRLMTVAQLEFAGDKSYPLILRFLESMIKAVKSYGAEGVENKRVAGDNLLSFENSFKAYTGFLSGLRDSALMARKREEEQTLRGAVMADAARQEKYGAVWSQVGSAYQEYGEFYKQYLLLESYAIRGSELFTITRDILRLVEEKQKPGEQRLREYRDSALPSLEQSMYSPAPLTDSMEIAVIANYFRILMTELGPEDPTVIQLLGGKSPDAAAASYVQTSKLKDIAERRRLAGSLEALRSSEDGMLRLARILDGPARSARKLYEDRLEAVINASAARLALARFATAGENAYPDATFTFRIAYGPAKGYRLNNQPIPYATNFAGLYKRATGVEPFSLPQTWSKAKSKLKLKTPFNFVTTSDTHGGNSGSPTINTKGEVIGILFDGNIESLPNRFVYTEETARSVHVASQGIIEALRKVYKAKAIVKELGMEK